MLFAASASIMSRSANEQFRRLHGQGIRRHLWSKLTGRTNSLLDLRSFESSLRVESRRAAGIQRVPLHLIRGSEARVRDFDADFRPLKAHSRERWVSIAMVQVQGRSLPAVELIQIGDVYFVRDGHHRVSVANTIGQIDIDANVVIWQVAEPTASLWALQRGQPLHQAITRAGSQVIDRGLDGLGRAMVLMGTWLQSATQRNVASPA